eukprot:m.184000 g.184000  ORF g.184000 m.184000 type:complete len:91 (+) comp25526_c0_seq10:1376-1648(+)
MLLVSRFSSSHTVGVAVGIPKLGLVISLVGSIGSGCLALIFPPLLHLYGTEKGSLSLPIRIKDWAIVVFGVLGSAAGTFVSIQQIAESFK